VSDRIILRERALMDMLKTRTPLVETYLQNLKPDPLLGAVPKEDHYFLGRLDLGDTMDRRDYLTMTKAFRKICWAESASYSGSSTSRWAFPG
jgi:hypothetical protein